MASRSASTTCCSRSTPCRTSSTSSPAPMGGVRWAWPRAGRARWCSACAHRTPRSRSCCAWGSFPSTSSQAWRRHRSRPALTAQSVPLAPDLSRSVRSISSRSRSIATRTRCRSRTWTTSCCASIRRRIRSSRYARCCRGPPTWWVGSSPRRSIRCRAAPT